MLIIVHLHLAVCGDQQIAKRTHHNDLMLSGGLVRSFVQFSQRRRHSDPLVMQLDLLLGVKIQVCLVGGHGERSLVIRFASCFLVRC